MTQTVDVRFGLAFVQLINVVSIATSNAFGHRKFSFASIRLSERKKSNYEIECVAASRVERLSIAMG